MIAADLPPFVESRIDVGTDRFEYQLADADGDARVDLFVTSVVGDERTLRLWRQRADATIPPAPDFQMAIPPDVVAWSLFDVRDEPGKEVLLLTRSGIFSLSPTKSGLQGNLRRELTLSLFPDLADPDRLPCWRLMKDVDGDGRVELLVVSGTDLVALSVEPGADGVRHLVPKLRIPTRPPEKRGEAKGDTHLSFGGGGLEVDSRRGMSTQFPGARSSRPAFGGEALLSHQRSVALPALLDWDGDGRLDQVELLPASLSVRLQSADGSFAEPPSVRPTPSVVHDGKSDSGSTRLELADVDGDGRSELVAWKEVGSGMSSDHIALVFPRGADGWPVETPSARVKLSGMDVDYSLVDIDGDKRLDLIARTTDVPTGLTTLATIRLDTSFCIFRGGPGATWSREPDVRLARSFKPELLARAEEVLLTKIDGDFDQDGLNDLVLTEPDGRIEIRPLVRAGGTADGKLELSPKTLAAFQPFAPVERLETWDLSMDHVADLMLRHDRGFTFFISKIEPGKKGEGR